MTTVTQHIPSGLFPRWTGWLLIGLMLLGGLMMSLFVLPDTVPIHFNIHGQADDWGRPLPVLLILPGVMALAYALTGTNYMRTRVEDQARAKAQAQVVVDIILVMILVLQGEIAYSMYLGHMPDFLLEGVILVFLGIMGLFLGRVRPNPYVGIRVPPTLLDEDIWVKTHRLSARILPLTCLIALLVLPILPPKALVFAVLGAVLIGAMVPVVYSYILYHQKRGSARL